MLALDAAVHPGARSGCIEEFERRYVRASCLLRPRRQRRQGGRGRRASRGATSSSCGARTAQVSRRRRVARGRGDILAPSRMSDRRSEPATARRFGVPGADRALRAAPAHRHRRHGHRVPGAARAGRRLRARRGAQAAAPAPAARWPEFAAELLDEAKVGVAHPPPERGAGARRRRRSDGVFLVMEYIEGDTLAGLLHALATRRRAAAAGADRACAFCATPGGPARGARALRRRRASLAALVHRDFSPQNILVGVDGAARLDRLRHRQGADRSHWSHANRRLVKGKIRVHVAGAGARRAARPSLGRLVGRRRRLGAVRGATALSRWRRRRHAAPDRDRAAAQAARRASRRPAGARRRDFERARRRSRGTLSDRRRAATPNSGGAPGERRYRGFGRGRRIRIDAESAEARRASRACRSRQARPRTERSRAFTLPRFGSSFHGPCERAGDRSGYCHGSAPKWQGSPRRSPRVGNDRNARRLERWRTGAVPREERCTRRHWQRSIRDARRRAKPRNRLRRERPSRRLSLQRSTAPRPRSFEWLPTCRSPGSGSRGAPSRSLRRNAT